MRYVFAVILLLTPWYASAQEWEDRHLFEGRAGTSVLKVLSSTDTSIFAPIIGAYLEGRSGVNVEYFVTSTADMDRVFRAAPTEFDVVISSAMDLQLKLVNDGFAAEISALTHPDWAQWRQSLFGFTTEPATIVVNKAAFEAETVPQSRQELIAALRARPEAFRGKVGTYDVRQSGLGYLFATQDARASETYWRLMEVMGSLDAKLYCCSGQMIDDLAAGDLDVAYNVLGSYVSARQDVADRLEIILPTDFPTTMMRTAFVSEQTDMLEDAIAFVRHLLDVQAGTPDPQDFPLPPLSAAADSAGQAVIALEPALMIYLDPLKRKTFIKEWSSAVIQ